MEFSRNPTVFFLVNSCPTSQRFSTLLTLGWWSCILCHWENDGEGWEPPWLPPTSYLGRLGDCPHPGCLCNSASCSSCAIVPLSLDGLHQHISVLKHLPSFFSFIYMCIECHLPFLRVISEIPPFPISFYFVSLFLFTVKLFSRILHSWPSPGHLYVTLASPPLRSATVPLSMSAMASSW
jgi:hypothetical protein